MGKFLAFSFLFLTCILSVPALGAQDSLINIAPGQLPQGLAPGSVITLPDGRQTIIMEILLDGDLATDLGITISPQGIIRTGESAGQRVSIDPAFAAQEDITIASPSGVPGEKPVPPLAQTRISPSEKQIEAPGKAAEKKADKPLQPAGQKNTEKPGQPDLQKNKAAQAAGPKEEKPLTLAEMLPLTTISPAKEQKPTPEAKKKPAEKKAVPPVQEKKAEKQATPKKEKKPEPAMPKQQAKAKAGEEMRIPPEAIKSGNLDFLEGCWQGTRPEYYSKRTVKECFCFGAGGKNGKRRIYDAAGGRMCIGGTRARLSKNGVLSVTSEGAACNDGERWGSAEMECKNSGPRTPCSWIFRDANNGHQAYTIPFVRVEQCGR